MEPGCPQAVGAPRIPGAGGLSCSISVASTKPERILLFEISGSNYHAPTFDGFWDQQTQVLGRSTRLGSSLRSSMGSVPL